jgi:hypothetical protein
MNNRLIPLATLALLGSLAAEASAQTKPAAEAPQPIGTCVLIQTDLTTNQLPTGLQAYGSCTTSEGGERSCTAEVVPTAADMILDVTDTDNLASCQKVEGDDPCAQIQSGPVIFQSDRHATQTYGAYVGRARMTVTVRQKRVEQQWHDRPPGEPFPLVPGRMFDVLKYRSAAAARLQCKMNDGDQRIFPLAGNTDLSPQIRFVSKNSTEPAFEVFTYRVTPQ